MRPIRSGCSSTIRPASGSRRISGMWGLHRTAAYILGVSPEEEPPRLGGIDSTPPIDGPYACIAVAKQQRLQILEQPAWLAGGRGLPEGAWLSRVCIDQKPVHGHGLMWTHIPHGAERPDGRPAAGRAGEVAAARLAVRRAVERPVLARLGGRLPGGADQRLHPSDQRVLHAVPGDQLARMQFLLERPGGAVSTIRISCGARGTPGRAGNSNARG